MATQFCLKGCVIEVYLFNNGEGQNFLKLENK